ncbi:NarL family transcriptional regulator [Streptomyces lunaelactis]|uniref:NarL family transcriptional regulator n=1 Tax=Streptomyces lunaelactis TaxID=1535768 RepID=A0A2R4TBW0_9ACTN|nr:NAD-dependent epimerase/dehydratase family protein [Streptomyces lunaelactis]AVZ76615.1 NarL family transcriptional regulator [Streptomyces lunaelactis]NUK83131.1 NAD-dependent epimerase/dehydratase family protein [Streptomyces lunaelactis]
MRILLLGSTGFLGGHTAELLRALPGVRLLVGGRSAASDVPLDLTAGPGVLADALHAAAPSVVVNCAGLVAGSAVHLTDVNARGPAALCEALRDAAPAARLVHLGSAAEYGPTAPGEPVTESAATRPLSPYGATKLAGTVAVTSSGLDAVVLRVFNPVGPGAPPAGLAGRLATELVRAGDEGVVRVGDLSAHRDFVDVRDVAAAAVRAATTQGPLPPVLNIGSGSATAARELAASLVRVAGFRGHLEETGDGSARSTAVSWQCADIAAARAALDWHPEHTLTDSLTDLWESRTPSRAAR